MRRRIRVSTSDTASRSEDGPVGCRDRNLTSIPETRATSPIWVTQDLSGSGPVCLGMVTFDSAEGGSDQVPDDKSFLPDQLSDSVIATDDWVSSPRQVVLQ